MLQLIAGEIEEALARLPVMIIAPLTMAWHRPFLLDA
jgi:hypothetical protein